MFFLNLPKIIFLNALTSYIYHDAKNTTNPDNMEHSVTDSLSVSNPYFTALLSTEVLLILSLCLFGAFTGDI